MVLSLSLERLRLVQERISKLIDMHIDGKIDAQIYHVKLQEYKREKQSLTVQLQSYNSDTKAELIAAREVLTLAQQAKEDFMSSKLEEKQQLLRFFFSNLQLNTEKLDVELREPFKIMSATHDQHIWRPLRDLFLNREITFGFNLQHIQTVCSTFSINVAV